MVQFKNTQPLDPDQHSKNWTYIIIALIVAIIAILACTTIIFSICANDLTSAEKMEHFKDMGGTVSVYLAGLGTAPVLTRLFNFINSLMKDDH